MNIRINKQPYTKYMKKLYANGSRLQSDAGRTKKWNVNKPEMVVYQYERFSVGTKRDYEKAKKQLESAK